MKLKVKLLLINSAAIICILIIGGIIIYSNLASLTEKNIEKELSALNEMSFNLVETMVNTTIVNYLRFKSMQFLAGVKWYYDEFKAGKHTPARLRNLIKILLEYEKIGKTGYMFAMNSQGQILYHPQENLINTNIKNFIQPIPNDEMRERSLSAQAYLAYKLSKRDGYLEFIDKTQQESKREKAMYMSYYPEQDFILCVTAYKVEFPSLIVTQEVMDKIISHRSSAKQYFYVLNEKGFMISHLKQFPFSLIQLKDLNGIHFIREMIKRKNGKIVYTFKNIADKYPQEKIALFRHLDNLNWVIVSVSNREDVFTPVYRIRTIIIIIGLVIIGVLFIIILWTSSLIVRPINRLMQTIYEMKQGNLEARSEISTRDEIGELGKTYNEMADTIRDYTNNLEEKVKLRTEELKTALDEVQTLNEQQNGDYFLTSLIINPLLAKRYKSDILNIELYLSQKKKFHFRKRDGEIGGDVNIIHTIHIRGKKYTVFANGDAMGKSLQGAGGALVMGTVFNAFVERTKTLEYAQSLTPERWLRECYFELQSIFVSFDGSMLISAVIGMIDDVSGLLYFFNAEHPWPVLFRNGKAEFAQSELDIRKIGTIEDDKDLIIRTLQLQPGDSLFIGSDGRDDIMLGNDEETGMRIINEDETLFLRTIENAGGNFNEVIHKTLELGEITDDFSLIKIDFNTEPEWKKNNQHSEYLSEKERGMKALEEKNSDRAIEHFSKAIEIYPDEECLKNLAKCYKENSSPEKELEMLKKIIWFYPGTDNLGAVFRASLLSKALKDYQTAIDYGESYRNYYPSHVNNLVNLADTYRYIRQYSKAEKIISLAESYEPDNIHVKKLKQTISTRNVK